MASAKIVSFSTLRSPTWMIENEAWKRAAKRHAAASPGRNRGEKAVANAKRDEPGSSIAQSGLSCKENRQMTRAALFV